MKENVTSQDDASRVDERIEQLRKVGFKSMADSAPQYRKTRVGRRLYRLLLISCFVFLALSLAGIMMWTYKVQPDLAIAKETTMSSAIADTPRVQTSPTIRIITASGYIVPERIATVSSDEIGRVVEIYVAVGAQVRYEEPLARLDDSRELNARDVAIVRKKVAESEVSEALAAANAAGEQLKRKNILFKRGIIAQSVLDSIKSEFDVLAARLHTTQQLLRLQTQKLVQAQAALDRRVIKAPFNGVISEINAQVGEIISPTSGGMAFIRTGICTIIDRSHLYAQVEVDESMILATTHASQIEIEVPALNLFFIGKLSNTAYEINRSTGTGLLKIKVMDPPLNLLPNMTVKAHLPVKSVSKQQGIY